MKPRTKIWWKVYFWLMAALVIGAVLFELYKEETPAASDIVDYGTWLFSLFGVFGFAYSKTILSKRLWQMWLPIVVVWDLAILGKEYLFEPVEIDLWLLVFMVIFAGILVLPEYLALYLYGYRSNSLWTRKI